MRKLNKWHRLGIALSIFWILFSLFRGADKYDDMRRTSIDLHLEICRKTKSFEVCWNEISANQLQTNWTVIWIEALVPLVLAWIIVIILIGTYRWIMRGQ